MPQTYPSVSYNPYRKLFKKFQSIKSTVEINDVSKIHLNIQDDNDEEDRNEQDASEAYINICDDVSNKLNT